MADKKERPLWLRRTLAVVDYLISQWFIIGMGVVVALAYKFPSVAKNHGHIRADITIEYVAVAIIFVISGMNIPRAKLIQEAGHWQAHLVTQVTSFLITPAIAFGFASAIRRAHNPNISPWILIGIIITGCTPTTVSSNVVMTRTAKGNESLSLIEVSIGNVLGAFISPALAQMFMSKNTGFSYGNPTADMSMTELYRHVMKQLGLSLFVPLFVGQMIQYFFPSQTKYLLAKFKLAKVGTFCLLLLIWSSFSNSFATGAFEEVSHASVIMVCFLNVGLYLFYTVICLLLARCPFLPKKYHFSRPDTVAICLCGAAKTVALGVPLINAQYSGSPDKIGLVSIALVLYQGEQILVAQLLVPVLKKWVETEIKAKKDLEAAAAAAAVTDGSAGPTDDKTDLDDGALNEKDALVASADSKNESSTPSSTSRYSSEIESGVVGAPAAAGKSEKE
ncbi:SBF-like CPA transporter family-domain-containing protein [Myxozyma melibiosi]|uniref:SBF-like CPA transporter family-domain-containing protein n=1 Tax=Myxozyma melibiosi TaxID=54550 RepID=A0ABR1FDA1_9ASCO